MSFDIPISRDGTHSEKYGALIEKFNSSDLLPLWVADMDLPASKAIQDALIKRVKHPIYGYTRYHDEYFNSIKRWMLKAHNYKIENSWISPINGIVTGLILAVEALTKKGDGVIIQPPIYPPFYGAIKNQKRRVLENELRLVNGKYEIDFEDFSKKAKEAKLFLFCSPHNPTGRVWRESELKKIAKICKENGVLIVSDEVHADLVYKENIHIPIAMIEDAKDITVTLNAPSKTFNVAGIVNAYAIVQNDSLRRKFHSIFQRYSLNEAKSISIVTTIAAYKESDEWLKKLLAYLENNLKFLNRALMDTPKIKAMHIEATSLLWLDCRELNLSNKELKEFFIKEAKLGLNFGSSFGKGGDGFMRLNFATPKVTLIKALEQLKAAYKRFL